MTFDSAVNEYVRAEMVRRARLTESLLRQAIDGGAATLTLEWPGDFGQATRYELPITRRARRRLVRQADRCLDALAKAKTR